MKKLLKESGDPFRDIVKKYAQLYRDSELARIDKSQYNAWLQAHADKISPSVKADIEKKVNVKLKKKDEASTSGAAGAYMTPFAFSRKGPGNVRAATQLGFKLAKPVKKSPGYALENQMYSEPAYVTPAQNIEPVSTYKDKNGLVQHGDPELDPGLAGKTQTTLPTTEQRKSVKKIIEGYRASRFLAKEADATQQTQQPTAAVPQQQAEPQTAEPNVNVQSYDIQPDFTQFDTKLKDATEQTKLELQKKIQDQILNKKIVVRASKGYKQPETDYTINVTGVQIDYYYDRYVIIILGREESKQKAAKFFVKPGFKIKILGPADVKQRDKYQIAKSKALVDPSQQTTAGASNVVTSKQPAPAKSEEKPEAQPAPPA
jgi:hypothetical protein|tara:strand:+ start:1198 stop:2319 length:1122 start_codon:yes stop_codon:yes gene_type:complete